MTNKTNFRNFKDYVLDNLKDPKNAKEYLKVALEEYLEDNNKEAFYQALKDVVDANGGATTISQSAQISRQNLYKVFSGKTNPRIETIGSILNNLGLTLTIEAV
jgi:probable addiction module antidote protein